MKFKIFQANIFQLKFKKNAPYQYKIFKTAPNVNKPIEFIFKRISYKLKKC